MTQLIKLDGKLIPYDEAKRILKRRHKKTKFTKSSKTTY